MEAGAEAVALVAADVGEPERAGLEGFGIAAFGHEEDAIWREGELLLEGLDFFEVVLVADDKFEDGSGERREEEEGLEAETKLLGHAGVGEFWGDVELGGEGDEVVVRDLGAVGLNFNEGNFGQEFDEFGEFLLLEEGLAAGEDEAVTLITRDERGDFGGR